jgi:glycerol-3-phosphate dehydrogenase
MVWTSGWRSQIWSQLDQEFDVLIIGGGITGAGIIQQVTQAGLRALLVEARDFASGTSSRSSKLVHGGLRYLRNAQLRLTLESVREREYLLRQGRGLVNRLGFLYTSMQDDKLPGWIFGFGLIAYDLMAHQWSHRAYDELDMREICPQLTNPYLTGGYRYFDAQTDDARLVLRLILESVASGALAINYAKVTKILQQSDGQVKGVVLEDDSGGGLGQIEARAKVIINATGAWADQLRGELGQTPRLRPLRGSHLVVPFNSLPLTRAVTFLHPRDGRPVFVLPWEGVMIYGTTDVDHKTDLETDPAISAEEVDYLLSSLQYIFPAQELTEKDILATFSGLRPVVNTGKVNPSKESREYVLWEEQGLLTVSGGKLTTFRLMARDALRLVQKHLSGVAFAKEAPILETIPLQIEKVLTAAPLSPAQRLRLLGRYGRQAVNLLDSLQPSNFEQIPGTPYLWAELRHAANTEGVVHLEDLLMRRLRIGLVCQNGGLDLMERIRMVAQPGLGWDDYKWEQEVMAYKNLWNTRYSFH